MRRNIEVSDDKLGFVAALELTTQKARVLLRLGPMETQAPVEIQRIFNGY